MFERTYEEKILILYHVLHWGKVLWRQAAYNKGKSLGFIHLKQKNKNKYRDISDVKPNSESVRRFWKRRKRTPSIIHECTDIVSENKNGRIIEQNM